LLVKQGISSRKGINVPNIQLDIPCLTNKDLRDLEFAFTCDPDYIALSFVRKAANIKELREKIMEHTEREIPIISKIEHAFAIKNFDDILRESDAIMVARGDLGIETSVSQLPVLQKEIIRKCNIVGKPVITATQMLESMVSNAKPTRAEASDVANAIYDGTDAVMLSAETAIGSYPIESIKIMKEIAQKVEPVLHWKDFPIDETNFKVNPIAEIIAKAAGIFVDEMPIKAILAFTQGGFSARLIAKHRPRTKILVATEKNSTLRQLGLIWGAIPMKIEKYGDTDKMVVDAVAQAKKIGHLQNEDNIVVISGSILSPGKTNLLRAYEVSDIPSPQEFREKQKNL
jgi:pyruvate kinase